MSQKYIHYFKITGWGQDGIAKFLVQKVCLHLILCLQYTGAALLVSGIVVSALWAGSFAGTVIRNGTVLNGVSIMALGSVNASIRIL